MLTRSRETQRLHYWRAVKPDYAAAADALASRGCRDVAIAIGPNDPEYVIWALLRDRGQRPRIEHAMVSNVSRAAAPANAGVPPCALVVDAPLQATAARIDGEWYQRAWSAGSVAILTPAGPPMETSADVGPVAWVRITVSDGPLPGGKGVTLGLDVNNPADGPPALLFLGLLLPDKTSALVMDGSGWLVHMSREHPRGFPPARRVPAGSRLRDASVLEAALSALGPAAGGHSFFAALVREGALDDDRVDAGDILAHDVRDVPAARP